MANCRNRCPRCGRIRRNCCPAADKELRAGVNGIRTANDGACISASGVAKELYGAPDTKAFRRVCCDRYGCWECDERNRCPYWPGFAHPRWLTCRALYAKNGACPKKL